METNKSFKAGGKEREHYYYTLNDKDHGQWLIIKANNQRQIKQHGYDVKSITDRNRHYDDASRNIRHRHGLATVKYLSLTGIDFID